MEPTELAERCGRRPDLTVAVDPPAEIVGPLRPKKVVYGLTVEQNHVLQEPPTERVLIRVSFNKFNPHLPPWGLAAEMVLASDDQRVLLGGLNHLGTQTTGGLKTVSIEAEAVSTDLRDATFIDRDGTLKDSAGLSWVVD